MAESVELATILLTDLVGSTRLATTVGPTRADQLREEHFALLREAIGTHEGREGKNTGDGLQVAFGSASAAVRCAVLMQQLFERRYRDSEQGLHIRIGLAAGESTVKDEDHFGMPSIEAARLCAQAAPDGILASATVKLLAGHTDSAEYSSAGQIELKGFPDPVEAFTVSWSPLAEEGGGASEAGAWPLPPVLRSVPNLSYVGRTGERAAIEGALTQASNQARQVLLLCGEPGIGKTRLASHSAHRAHAQGFVVLWGSCSEELAVPYEPWIEACSQLVEHAPQELIERHVERHAGELRRLVRELDRRVADLPAPQSSDPETERYLLFSAVTGLLGEVAQELPVCLVLDDMHWADAQSMALLKHLARTVEHEALLVIVTYRDSDLGKDHPLTAVLADLHRIEGSQRIALHGLGPDEVAQILTTSAGHELDEEGLALAGEIAAETDGNPFFVAEILRNLLESGAIVFDEQSARWSVDRSGLALPESVREVIERRVERLGHETLEALRLAAVIGREFDLQLLSVALGIDETALLDHLEAAVAASVLSESSEQIGRFRFVHALINQTLYEGVGSTRRARMHQRVAEALETLYGADTDDYLADLALHWRLAAVSVDKAKAAHYGLKAGERALSKLAPAEALKLFSHAIELSGDAEVSARCEALIGLGEAQRQTGDPAYRDSLLEASRIASELGSAELAARAALASYRGSYGVIGAVDEERVAAIERAIGLDEPQNPARRARLLALQALELTFGPEFARRKALADEAVALARSAGDARTLAEVERNVSYAYWSPETLDLRTTISNELSDLAATVGDPALRLAAHTARCRVSIERGEFERAEAALAGERQIAAELAQPTLQWLATWHAAGLELLKGDLAAGERLAERAFHVGQEAGEPDAVFIYGAQLTLTRIYQGRGAEIIGMIEQAVSNYPDVAGWRAAFVVALSWIDRQEEAKTILEQAASDGFEHVTPGAAWSLTLALYADAAARTGDADAASALYRLIEPWGDQVVWCGMFGQGHTRMWLGLLAAVGGNHEQAEAHLAFACRFHETNDLQLWAARGHLGWAEILAMRGDTAAARRHAAGALELSREHGYGAFEAPAAALIKTGSAAAS